MSWGLEQYGPASWGGSDFVVINHFPADNSTGNNRLSTINFTLYSQSGNVTFSSINLTANGIQLILNGAFTPNATGTIDNSNPASVNVSATLTHALAPFTLVNVVVSAINASAQTPVSGTTWSFTVDGTLILFSNYIVRKFERVLRIGIAGLDAPRNPGAEVVIAPPANLQAVEL
jgi:hypothetical protein